MLLFKVIPTGYGIPYGGAPVTGLTNLLYEVNASRDTFSLQPVYSIRLLQIEYNHRQASFIPSPFVFGVSYFRFRTDMILFFWFLPLDDYEPL